MRPRFFRAAAVEPHEGAQARPAVGVRAGREGGVAAADEDELLGVGLERRARGEAVFGAHRGERGDRGGDLRGGRRGQRLVGPGAVQPFAGGHVDDRGGAPRAEGRIAQEGLQDAREARAGREDGRGGLHGVDGAPEAREDGRGTRGGPRRSGGRVGRRRIGRIVRAAVICATRPFQGGGPVPLRRTLTGGVPGADGGHHTGGQCQPGGRRTRGVLPGPGALPGHRLRDACEMRLGRLCEPCDLRLGGGAHARETRPYDPCGLCQTRSYGVRGPHHVRSRGPPRPQLWHEHQPLSRSPSCVRDT